LLIRGSGFFEQDVVGRGPATGGQQETTRTESQAKGYTFHGSYTVSESVVSSESGIRGEKARQLFRFRCISSRNVRKLA
jgi:hypothetical protein